MIIVNNILSYLYIFLLFILFVLILFKSNDVRIKIFTLFVSLFFSILILNENIHEQFLYTLLRFIYYPEFNSFFFILIFIFIYLLIIICSKKFKFIYTGLNLIYFFFLIIIVNYLFSICSDVYSYNELYSGNFLIICRTISISFCIWFVLNTLYVVFFKKM